MPGSRCCIFSVDKNQQHQDELNQLLKDQFEFVPVSSAKECLQYLDKKSPDLILLETKLPSGSGYQLCSQLKSNRNTQNIPVIFISSLNSTDAVLAGFDVGCSDYLTRPFHKQEFLARINVCLKNKNRIDDLNNQTNNAMSSFSSMTNELSEYGIVINFLEETIACNSVKQLAEKLLFYVQSFGLVCAVQIRMANQIINFGDDILGSLESRLLSLAQNEGRIFSINNRVIFNYDKLSLLVKNMPVDDEEACGRLRDHICTMLNGAHSKIEMLNIGEQLSKYCTAVKELKDNVLKIVLELIDNKSCNNKCVTSLVIDKFLTNMNLSLDTLGVSKEKEKDFVQKVNETMNELIKVYQEEVDVGRSFYKVLEDFEKIIFRETI